MVAVDLGIISYDEGLQIQEMIHAARVQDRGEDVLLLLEHHPIITCGRRGGEEDLLVPLHELGARGVEVRHVNRGGKMTCHYPGQLVVYPIMRLDSRHIDLLHFICRLEEVIIGSLGDYGIAGMRITNLRGIWVDDRKIAAIGIEVRKNVSMHGFSLNVFEDSRLYRLFIPCGIMDRGVTFLGPQLPTETELNMGMVKDSIIKHFARVFEVDISSFLPRETFQREFSIMRG